MDSPEIPMEILVLQSGPGGINVEAVMKTSPSLKLITSCISRAGSCCRLSRERCLSVLGLDPMPWGQAGIVPRWQQCTQRDVRCKAELGSHSTGERLVMASVAKVTFCSGSDGTCSSCLLRLVSVQLQTFSICSQNPTPVTTAISDFGSGPWALPSHLLLTLRANIRAGYGC